MILRAGGSEIIMVGMAALARVSLAILGPGRVALGLMTNARWGLNSISCMAASSLCWGSILAPVPTMRVVRSVRSALSSRRYSMRGVVPMQPILRMPSLTGWGNDVSPCGVVMWGWLVLMVLGYILFFAFC